MIFFINCSIKISISSVEALLYTFVFLIFLLLIFKKKMYVPVLLVFFTTVKEI